MRPGDTFSWLLPEGWFATCYTHPALEGPAYFKAPSEDSRLLLLPSSGNCHLLSTKGDSRWWELSHVVSVSHNMLTLEGGLCL